MLFIDQFAYLLNSGGLGEMLNNQIFKRAFRRNCLSEMLLIGHFVPLLSHVSRQICLSFKNAEIFFIRKPGLLPIITVCINCSIICFALGSFLFKQTARIRFLLEPIIAERFSFFNSSNAY